jgi:hypothetical protein
MVYKKLALLAILSILASASYAGIFGPKTFDECLDDGKTGRSPQELNIRRNSCRAKFPLMPKLLKGGSGEMVCMADRAGELVLKYKNGTIIGQSSKEKLPQLIDGVYYLKNTEVFKVNYSKKSKLLRVDLSIYPAGGSVTMTLFDPDDLTRIDTFSYDCVEK